MRLISDETLAREAQQGNTVALTELIVRYEQRTYHLAFRLLNNQADAADATQESLVRLYTRLPHFRGDAAFSTWLYRVVTNTCLDEIRRQNRSHYIPLAEPLGALSGPAQDLLQPVGQNPAEVAEQREIQAAVQRAIGRLPNEYRTVLLLRDLQDHSYREIATILETSVGTIKSRLHRARMALRVVLQQTEGRKLGISERIAG